MPAPTVHIGILYLDLFLGEARSLKEKRMVLKSIKDKVRARFNVSVAELDGHDKWQVATLGFCMLGPDRRYIDRTLQHAGSLVEGVRAVEVTSRDMEFC